ncbi:glutathione-specific gamma-glutamylcyclotransferase 1-like [Tubulanus polymorphus]|uniref:glutathione-specific gamma-glutamylcyclotransferase 1-like n=1 Tax=Tubulanus polymorphus TaxID=672921 RepID=UPI003DA6CBBB
MIILPEEKERLWIFGYGSLLWKPGFEYENELIGFIKGYSRKFWQSSTHHRGTKTYPGRVATLVPNENSTVWGTAFEVVGRTQVKEALLHLNGREILNGGYTMFHSKFYQYSTDSRRSDSDISVIVYSATCDNRLYTGPEEDDVLAERIVNARGSSGHNVEYVTRIAEYLRTRFPADCYDHHLQTLDSLIRLKLKQRQIDCVRDLWYLGTSALDSKTHSHPVDENNNNSKS